MRGRGAYRLLPSCALANLLTAQKHLLAVPGQ